MTDRSKKFLSDIQQSIRLINDFTDSIVEFSNYQADLKTKSAVERQLGIIGDAVNNYVREGNPPLNYAPQIVAFRNRLIHAYDSIDDSIVWVTIQNHLPKLKTEVDILLNPSL